MVGTFIEHKKLVFEDFWLFLRSLSCIGSSGRLVGRISTKFRPNPRQPLPIRSKNRTLLTGGVINCTWGLNTYFAETMATITNRHNKNPLSWFHTIFGHMEALGFLYLLTRFPTLTPSGEQENEGKGAKSWEKGLWPKWHFLIVLKGIWHFRLEKKPVL